MHHSRSGFTIVELLIIIVVLGILVGIGFISWSGVLSSSRDSARSTDLKQWANTFDTYKARFASYPILLPATQTGPDNGTMYCLGLFTGAPYNGKCGAYTAGSAPQAISGSNSADLITEIKKIGNAPSNSSQAVGGKLVGPLVYMWQEESDGTSVVVHARFINFFENTAACPAGLDPEESPSPTDIMTAAAPNVSTLVCSFDKSYSYDPGA